MKAPLVSLKPLGQLHSRAPQPSTARGRLPAVGLRPQLYSMGLCPNCERLPALGLRPQPRNKAARLRAHEGPKARVRPLPLGRRQAAAWRQGAHSHQGLSRYGSLCQAPPVPAVAAAAAVRHRRRPSCQVRRRWPGRQRRWPGWWRRCQHLPWLQLLRLLHQAWPWGLPQAARRRWGQRPCRGKHTPPPHPPTHPHLHSHNQHQLHQC